MVNVRNTCATSSKMDIGVQNNENIAHARHGGRFMVLNSRSSQVHKCMCDSLQNTKNYTKFVNGP